MRWFCPIGYMYGVIYLHLNHKNQPFMKVNKPYMDCTDIESPVTRKHLLSEPTCSHEGLDRGITRQKWHEDFGFTCTNMESEDGNRPRVILLMEEIRHQG